MSEGESEVKRGETARGKEEREKEGRKEGKKERRGLKLPSLVRKYARRYGCCNASAAAEDDDDDDGEDPPQVK